MTALDIAKRLHVQSIGERLAAAPNAIALLRELNTQAMDDLHQRFRQHENIASLVHARAEFVDQLLAAVWSWCGLPMDQAISLIAVGGYGRGELQPHSDIDLLILIPDDFSNNQQPALEHFITLLWDIKLDIGHSVRTVEQCVEAAAEDITVATSLMEARLLAGSAAMLARLTEATAPQFVWPSREFFRAKWDEQIRRHRKYADTEYKLEPNVKSSPGGLRDIQTIAWIAKRHFETADIEELVARGFLTPAEFQIMTEGRDFLWLVRWALHMISGRAEDRLLFDHQHQVAELFGFVDNEEALAIEQFMQVYYRWALALSELNELVAQLYDEAILRACDPETIQPINQRFFVRNHYIDACNDKIFKTTPSAIMEIFVLMASDSSIIGPRASTIRLLREASHDIGDEFRNDPRNCQYFVELLRSPYKVSTQLTRMTRYGILGKYLPEFHRIIGKMQHDLFHVYTVDAHILQVVKNMRLFAHADFADKFPLASNIIQRMPKRELLYIAGLYHDIAKGRGGDHSEQGTEDARRFCENHGFGPRDTQLVVWLVRNHLLMSSTSQRKDISDPEVILNFAQAMGDQLHLDYLYALTVADISGTNPKLWTSWRASLMRQLYLETRRALRHSLEQHPNKRDWIEESKENAIRLLEEKGYDADEVIASWGNPDEDYFLRESAFDIAWHTEAIDQHPDPAVPLVLIKASTPRQSEGATQVFFRTPTPPNLFALVAVTIERLQLNIQDARLYQTDNGHIMGTYYVLESDGELIGNDPQRVDEISSTLSQALSEGQAPQTFSQRRVTRRLKHFDQPTEVKISNNDNKQCTIVEVITPDRPGVLARIGQVFLEFHLQLQNAKIATLGERVEDVFFITDDNGHPLGTQAQHEELSAALCSHLDQSANQESASTITL
jgi:[protein-PII] uridylyltransferase